jgi:UPF0755 protein
MAIQSATLRKKPKRKRFHRIIITALALAIIASLIIAYSLFRYIMVPNISTPGGEPVSIFIRSGSTYEDVKKSLYSKGIIRKQKSFEWVAEEKNYPALVKPGHYVVKDGMSNTELVNMLRSGAQTPVNVTFNNIRKLEELAGKVSAQIEADSVSLMKCWNDRAFLKTLGTELGKVLLMIIPNTYEFWWTSDAYEFTERMHKEYIAFWNEDRRMKAKSLKMSQNEIVILASIVEKETQKNDEKPVIAGVYINRLRKDWPLQADPTVVFAVGDFEMKRVLTVHTQIDSPYNTYKYTGLPPGPICMPSVASIDAVLNYRRHDYMFFCAKADMSGYHAFARTLREHNRNAKEYQQALNSRNIR